jgi:hypothetical protein
VTSATPGQATEFITMDSSTRLVTWITNSNAQVGTYTIKITGTISAATNWENYIEFNLTVTGSCASSTENN